ncbi:hypothetical protein H696_04957 [Fonticula alba]|uniref:Stealth protein CR2 conserved region 2 domain-containing protein n=1 Tax=Fonticula alba TaxID=691883 RepID=A0A058Z3F3_FONAL|nr:hypothetical protein H696_04957 [Fonticula alba]KCV68666.1 hypothetical protein H696_04957 [Fonticula alba]|eukprot:XP_009497098.1 hypothetical protein H696_04957 [Fonticula alba]
MRLARLLGLLLMGVFVVVLFTQMIVLVNTPPPGTDAPVKTNPPAGGTHEPANDAHVPDGQRATVDGKPGIYLSNPSYYKAGSNSNGFQASRAFIPDDLVTAASGDWAWAANVPIVYTWVNGSDPEYQEIRAKYGGTRSVGGSRDRDSGELRHSFRSLEIFAPWWKGQIFLVSPFAQSPPWLDPQHPRVTIIDQHSIMRDDGEQPTFNTNAIEQFFYRIPNIGPVFVHVNDDYFFGSPLYPWDLFLKDGGSKLFFERSPIRGTIENQRSYKKSRTKLWVASVYHTKWLMDEYYKKSVPLHFVKHSPFVYQTAVLKHLRENMLPEQYIQSSKHRFRHWDDVLTPFAHHAVMMEEASLFNTTAQVMTFEELVPQMAFLVLRDTTKPNDPTLLDILNRRPRMFAINDSFNTAAAGQILHDVISEMFPWVSSFEIDKRSLFRPVRYGIPLPVPTPEAPSASETAPAPETVSQSASLLAA